MLRTYILSFTGSELSAIAKVEDIIQSDRRMFASYWNYMPYIFCVKSEASALDIANLFERVTPNYFVAEVSPYNINGRLPKAAWEWFFSPPVTGGSPLTPFNPAGGTPPSTPFSSTKKSL